MTKSQLTKYQTSERAIRREIETALLTKHRRDAQRLAAKNAPAKQNERVKAFLLPEKQSFFISLGAALVKFANRLNQTLAKRPNHLQRLSILLDKSGQKSADDQARLVIVERLIDTMSRHEQRLQSHVRQTSRTAELLKKRAERKGRAKDVQAADATLVLAEAAQKDLRDFEKIKQTRLVILKRLHDDLEILVHDKNVGERLELLKMESELSIALAHEAVETSHVVEAAIKNRTDAVAKKVVDIELGLPEKIVVLNEDIFIPFEKQVAMLEELCQQSQQAFDNLAPVDLDILTHEQLLELTRAIEESLEHLVQVCEHAGKFKNEMTAKLKQYTDSSAVWHKRHTMALNHRNEELAAQALARAKQYEDSCMSLEPYYKVVQSNLDKLDEKVAKLKRAQYLASERLTPGQVQVT